MHVLSGMFGRSQRVSRNPQASGASWEMIKIRPCLDGLKRYDDVINVFVSSNPSHAALIWVSFTLLNSAVLTDVVTSGPNQVLAAGLVPLTSNSKLCL